MAKKKEVTLPENMSLELLLRSLNDDGESPEFRIGIMKEDKQGVHFLVHAIDSESETLHFIVKDNILYQR